jgi:hypothetical protein
LRHSQTVRNDVTSAHITLARLYRRTNPDKYLTIKGDQSGNIPRTATGQLHNAVH